MTCGDRWGEAAGLRGTHLWLASGSKLAPGQRHVAGKYTEVTCKEFVWDDFTKPGTVRTTAYHRALANRLEACFAELESESESDLMFPDPRLAAHQSGDSVSQIVAAVLARYCHALQGVEVGAERKQPGGAT